MSERESQTERVSGGVRERERRCKQTTGTTTMGGVGTRSRLERTHAGGKSCGVAGWVGWVGVRGE